MLWRIYKLDIGVAVECYNREYKFNGLAVKYNAAIQCAGRIVINHVPCNT